MADINNSANSSTDEHQIESEEVIIDVPADDDWEPKPGCCIYKVPIDLRNINTNAYTPQVISIGPLHHGIYALKDMQKQKKRYKHIFKERKGKEKWVEMESYIKSQEIKIRNCYEQPSLLERDQFVDMILDDTVFIIELFLRNYWQVDDFLLKNPRYRNTIIRDLQLLENQLPYYLLDELYISTINETDTHTPSFLDISCHFFGYDIIKMGGFRVNHFTDLRRHVLTQNHPTSEIQGKLEAMPCATKLDESGVRIIRNVEKQDCLLDLKFHIIKSGFFKKYELRIPRIIVNDWTEVLIRNVMALEQCHYPKQTHVCNYISLLDFLINTENDVDLLIEKGIIVNCLVENAIAKMFNGFCLQTSSPSSNYYDNAAAIVTMLKNLNGHISRSPSVYFSMGDTLKAHYLSHGCVRRWNRNMATLKIVYFRDIWTGSATVAAFILLVLTFIQAVCSILSLL